jgi:hypothetical protein
MIRKGLIYGLAGAAVLTGGAAILDTAEAQRGPRCRGMVYGEEVRGQIRFFTEGKARRGWSSRVTRRYSAEYANWSLARDRRMICRKGKPGRSWHCKAQGIPCNRAE